MSVIMTFPLLFRKDFFHNLLSWNITLALIIDFFFFHKNTVKNIDNCCYPVTHPSKLGWFWLVKFMILKMEISIFEADTHFALRHTIAN